VHGHLSQPSQLLAPKSESQYFSSLPAQAPI
jgi:hypothetical protein